MEICIKKASKGAMDRFGFSHHLIVNGRDSKYNAMFNCVEAARLYASGLIIRYGGEVFDETGEV